MLYDFKGSKESTWPSNREIDPTCGKNSQKSNQYEYITNIRGMITEWSCNQSL